MNLPSNHPQRIELNNEAHARPPQALSAPVRVSYLALFSDPAQRDTQRQQVAELAEAFGVAPPAPGAIHYSADLGRFRLKWEQHSEFARYKFITNGTGDDPFADPPILRVPADWVAALAGQIIVATHAALLPYGPAEPDFDEISARLFAGNTLVGANIASGAALALTDFRIRADDFSRLLILDRSLRPRQAGRALQRLLEIDTYRLMAQLTLPIARALAPQLSEHERELAEITNALTSVTDSGEPALLDRLIGLAAAIESSESRHHFRFSAARAYYQLVQRRIEELREDRIPAIQTFSEFTELRLAPAMNTCNAVAARQDSLSLRVTRATQLLSTRVEITREHQEMAVLTSMNQRADLQLRLQQTVEGLSVAAITYYITGLIGYVARGAQATGLPVRPHLVMGASIPLVVLLVALAIRRIHRRVHREAGLPGHK
ncbi:MAG: hypothetical protein B7Z78_10325 [Rhodospirillales bacterium 20-60-12]|nr:MAG: hypothetical protein B7Z78_10325 [Rhodospirillales bacterium 20-60-12]HQT67923.1 DUF3422 domain-containing protein [Acetobacteraceae bacterium]